MPTIPKTFDKDNPRFDKNPNDFFETPVEIATECLKVLNYVVGDNLPHNNPTILDVGCGSGVWGKAAKQVYPHSWLIGIDIVMPDFHKPYDIIYKIDYLKHFDEYDLIIGNPPYSSKDNRYLVNDIITHSSDLLADNGYIGMLLKTEFLASERRYKNIFTHHAPLFMYQLIPRPYWTNYANGYVHNHKSSNTIEYAFYIWQKQKNTETKVRWLNWKL
jgi:methyltransferase family protein